MILNWHYNNNLDNHINIKNIILNNNYSSIDIGPSANFWSYPECKAAIDSRPIYKDDCLFFNINLESKKDRDSVLDYVESHGKFDFSICSHTLEDIFNPLEIISFLEKISMRGYIAVPSKYDEFKKLFNNKYRGNAHHKQFFDIINNELIVYPKFNWIETDSRSDLISNKNIGRELSFFWEDAIPVKIFGNGQSFISDDQLISAFYKELLNE
jgi:hypothetical protein